MSADVSNDPRGTVFTGQPDLSLRQLQLVSRILEMVEREVDYELAARGRLAAKISCKFTLDEIKVLRKLYADWETSEE